MTDDCFLFCLILMKFGHSWAASMIGSFGLVAAQPMPFTQKLVQARMYVLFIYTNSPEILEGIYSIVFCPGMLKV